MTAVDQAIPSPSLASQLITPIAFVIAIGVIQIACAFYCLNAGSIKHWGTTIVVTGMLLDIAVIGYTLNRTARIAAGRVRPLA